MKFNRAVIGLSLILFSCNNESDTTEQTMKDTSSNVRDTTSQSASTASKGSDELMKAMSTMMQDMKSMQMTEDPDHDFAMMMVRHHKGAIDMAHVALANGSDTTLKSMARKIRDDSEKENAELESFMNGHKGSKKSDFSKNAMAMMEKSAGKHTMTGTVDGDFASMMIQHHKDGIEMAREYLKSGTAATTKKIANNIITNQPKDIAKLQDWLNNHK